MGWGHGFNNQGREVGYGVEAICDEPGCSAKIDRGIAYLCGDMQADTFDGIGAGCGGYFCHDHLWLGFCILVGEEHQFVAVCKVCSDTRYDDDANFQPDWKIQLTNP